MRSSTPSRLRPSLILAIELLGLEDAAAHEAQLRRALAIVELHLGSGEIAKALERRLLITGAQALRVVPVKRGGTILFWELMDLLHLQAELVHNEVLLRGAMALGNAAASAGMAVGPGLAEAALLRDQVAEFPRIILDPRLLQEAELNPLLRDPDHSVPVELGYIRKLLRSDADGLWFIDYLRAFATEVREPSQYLNFLDHHRRLIERRLGAAGGLGRASRTWTWLWSYHNQTVDELHVGGVIDEADRSRLRLPSYNPLIYVFPSSVKVPD